MNRLISFFAVLAFVIPANADTLAIVGGFPTVRLAVQRIRMLAAGRGTTRLSGLAGLPTGIVALQCKGRESHRA